MSNGFPPNNIRFLGYSYYKMESAFRCQIATAPGIHSGSWPPYSLRMIKEPLDSDSQMAKTLLLSVTLGKPTFCFLWGYLSNFRKIKFPTNLMQE